MNTESVAPSTVSESVVARAPDLLSQIATLRGVTPERAKRILHRICVGSRISMLEVILTPFCIEAINYTRRTIDDLAKCRSQDEVLDALGYWEERRPLDYRVWPSSWLALRERDVIRRLGSILGLSGAGRRTT